MGPKRKINSTEKETKNGDEYGDESGGLRIRPPRRRAAIKAGEYPIDQFVPGEDEGIIRMAMIQKIRSVYDFNHL
jgi:hypothetical protein